MHKKYLYVAIAIFIFIVDRITKCAALAYCAESAYKVNSYLSYELTINRGISWGMFHSADSITFAIVSLVIAGITALLCKYAYKQYAQGKSIVGYVCIISGSVANLVDRIMYGGVIDFIVLSYQHYSWPVFNVADVAIVCGVFVLIFFDEK